MLAALLTASSLASTTPVVPTVQLTSGVKPGVAVDMPVLAAGTAGYKGAEATNAVAAALAAGFTHVHTAFDYYNLPEVGAALANKSRSDLFISGMTSPCSHPAAPPKRNVTDPAACYNLTLAEADGVLQSLKLDKLDLLMLHGPSEPFGHVGKCSPLACAARRASGRRRRRPARRPR